MRFKVQLVLISNDGKTLSTNDVATLEKNTGRVEDIGLTLADSKHILRGLQEVYWCNGSRPASGASEVAVDRGSRCPPRAHRRMSMAVAPRPGMSTIAAHATLQTLDPNKGL